MQRADTFWPLQLLEFHLSSVTLQAEGDKSRKGGPLPLPGWMHYRSPDFLACTMSHTILWRRQRCEQAETWGQRQKWLDEEPRKETLKVLPQSCPGPSDGAHLLAGDSHALQALQSPLDVPHALLQRPNCPHQPCVQFLGPQQGAFQSPCSADTQGRGLRRQLS